VLRLYKCIGTQRLTSVARNLVVHGAICATGIDPRMTLTPVSSQELLQLRPRWRGKRGRRKWSASREESLTITAHIGTHNWSGGKVDYQIEVYALYKGWAASLVGPTLVGSWRPTQNTGRLQPASSPMAAIRGTELGWSSPLSPTR